MIITASPQTPVRVISNHGFAEIVENLETGQKSLCSIRSFKKEERICSFSAKEICNKPNYLTVQISESEHIMLMPEFLQYINHSCDPNVFFDTEKFELIALRDIEENEELFFFYPSTELSMDQAFSCLCGSSNCLQQIQGAAFIDPAVIKQYRLTSFIKKQLGIN
jgi:hypothetical protein